VAEGPRRGACRFAGAAAKRRSEHTHAALGSVEGRLPHGEQSGRRARQNERGSPVCSTGKQCPRPANPSLGAPNRGCERDPSRSIRLPRRLPSAGDRSAASTAALRRRRPAAYANSDVREGANDCRAEGLLSTLVVVKQAKDSVRSRTARLRFPPVSLATLPNITNRPATSQLRRKGEKRRNFTVLVHRPLQSRDQC
jgi:hypothetical protein